MLFIRSNGTEWDVDGNLTLEGLQFLLGAGVQHVSLADGRHMFCGEETTTPSQVNHKATALSSPWAQVMGDVLILTPEEYAAMSTVRPFRAKS